MFTEQELFEKHFVVKRGVITAIDTSSESHTTGSGGHSHLGWDGRRHIAPVNISTQITKKSRVWIRFDGESNASTHLDFEDDEFPCTGGQNVGVISCQTTGELVSITNRSTGKSLSFCRDGNLFAALLIDEGHPLPGWGIELKNSGGATKIHESSQNCKLITDTIHIDELVIHTGRPGNFSSLEYWGKRIGVFLAATLLLWTAINWVDTALKGPGALHVVISWILFFLMLGVMVVTWRFSKWVLRDDPHARFVKTGGKDRIGDWETFEAKVIALQSHAARAAQS